MTRPDHTTSAHTLPGKRRAFEGVARRLDAGGTTARTLPRTPVRTPTSQPPPPAQRWVRKCDRSIKESDTPHTGHCWESTKDYHGPDYAFPFSGSYATVDHAIANDELGIGYRGFCYSDQHLDAALRIWFDGQADSVDDWGF